MNTICDKCKKHLGFTLLELMVAVVVLLAVMIAVGRIFSTTSDVSASGQAISETLRRSDMEHAPWTIVRSDDKKRARLAVARHILRQFQYSGRRDDVVGLKDDLIVLPAKDWNV